MADTPVVFHPSAADELEAAFAWYNKRNPQVAHAFWQEMENGIRNVSATPRLYPAYILNARRYLLLRFPYFIIFRETDAAIEILAVAHGRRKPGYWRKRLI